MFRRFFIFITILSLLTQANFCLAQTFTPNDPLLNRQWYVNNLQMSSVWYQETGKSSVVIAVVDSGVDISHPDLHDNIWVNQKEIDGDGIDNDKNGYIDDINGWDFINNVADPRPKYSADCLITLTCVHEAIEHGTVISGIAAAVGNNFQGIAGLSWHTKIMPLRVLDENGIGSTADVANAIDYAVKNKADIINLSFISIYYDDQLFQSIKRAYEAGVLIVSSAGNEEYYWQVNQTSGNYEQVAVPIDLDIDKRYPVCFDAVSGENMIIGVAASDENNRLSVFSNYGSSCVDVVAPGQNIFGTIVYNQAVPELNQSYGGNLSGTSLAAPMVSGIAALIKAHRPEFTNKQIRDFIINNASNIDTLNPSALVGKLGHGLLAPALIFNAFPQVEVGAKLIKGADSPSIYYLAGDGKRYVFPDAKVYFSWYDSFMDVKIVSPEVLANLPLGGIVNFRPGSLVKIQTDPKVYVVAKGGVLMWLEGDQLPVRFFGANWAQQVNDIADSFFINYKIGTALDNSTTFSPQVERLSVTTIDQDKGL
jgi:subtilisin family serine protease